MESAFGTKHLGKLKQKIQKKRLEKMVWKITVQISYYGIKAAGKTYRKLHGE